MNNECPHCGEEDPRHAPRDCRDYPWIEFTEEDEVEFREDEALRQFEARLKRVTFDVYRRMGCDKGILITNGVTGRWFRTLRDAELHLEEI